MVLKVILTYLVAIVIGLEYIWMRYNVMITCLEVIRMGIRHSNGLTGNINWTGCHINMGWSYGWH